MFYGVVEEGSIKDLKNFIKEIKDKRKAKKDEEIKRKKREENSRKQQEEFKRDQEKVNQELKSMTPEEKKKFKDFWNKKEKEFEALVKQELKKFMLDPQHKKRISENIDKWLEKGNATEEYKEFYKTGKMPKTHVYNGGDYWEIIDEDQYIRIICHETIIVPLADILEEKTDYTIGTGDGDEGCIYPEELMDEKTFYRWVYKQNKE